ncbi:MAG: hypothetical protein NVSMB27_36480 [Ktedonobacteraceae bacterium]
MKPVKEKTVRENRLQSIERLQLDGGHTVQHSDIHHLLIIDETVVPCTPTEYLLLLPLLKQAGRQVPFTRLVNSAYSCSLSQSSRRCLTQQVSRLRAKLWPFDLDILCLTGYGYILLSRTYQDMEVS